VPCVACDQAGAISASDCSRSGTGTCTCNTGFTGNDCSKCSSLFAGTNCNVQCLTCDSVGGTSYCGRAGNGSCVCKPGYAGKDCALKCGSCDSVGGISSCSSTGNGGCVCKPGFNGSDCSLCVIGKGGSTCSSVCQSCGTLGKSNCSRSNTASCICVQGFSGTNCSHCIGSGCSITSNVEFNYLILIDSKLTLSSSSIIVKSCINFTNTSIIIDATNITHEGFTVLQFDEACSSFENVTYSIVNSNDKIKCPIVQQAENNVKITSSCTTPTSTDFGLSEGRVVAIVFLAIIFIGITAGILLFYYHHKGHIIVHRKR